MEKKIFIDGNEAWFCGVLFKGDGYRRELWSNGIDWFECKASDCRFGVLRTMDFCEVADLLDEATGMVKGGEYERTEHNVSVDGYGFFQRTRIVRR